MLGTKRIGGSEDNARYRLLISDSKFVVSRTLLVTQPYDYTDGNELYDNTIIRIDEYTTSVANPETIVIIILGLTILLDAI